MVIANIIIEKNCRSSQLEKKAKELWDKCEAADLFDEEGFSEYMLDLGDITQKREPGSGKNAREVIKIVQKQYDAMMKRRAS